MKVVSYPSPNHSKRPESPDMIIIHYTDMRDAPSALERLCDPVAKVSAHYLIEKNGTVYKLVEETEKAHHAGISFWKNRTSLNDYSIGIELDNPGEQYGLAPFPKPQMDALVALMHQLQERFQIPNQLILGHSDVAPTRKRDPGPLFDWAYLADKGLGIFPDFRGPRRTEANLHHVQRALEDIGYVIASPTDLPFVIQAFQLHFYPENVTQALDPETIHRILTVRDRFN
ncbi:MAG: N-acetylmuramoyl-L-alanine amidase [Alphaproteobacteria bacterium]